MNAPGFKRIVPGLTGEYRLRVDAVNTAVHLGSGSVEVLATPEMVRMMERAAVATGDHLLPPGYRTVGIHLDIAHLAPTPVGMVVVASAELSAIEGRKLIFHVEARDERELIGAGTHQRMIINVERFQAKVESKKCS